jgi:asparagine synthase (glutamine-hydrolysing)
MRALDLGFFLPGDLLVKMDRATMACSLEARSPFLDHELLELACAIPTRALLRGWRTKAMLRDATVGLLPDAVRRAPKRGFEVPLERWLEHEWAGEVTTVLEDGGAAIRSLIPSERLRSFRGWRSWPDRTRGARAVYTLIVLEHWLRRWPATL